MEIETRFASLNAGKTDELVVNKDSTITKKATKVVVDKYLAETSKKKTFFRQLKKS